jgi:hypothetical protein
MPQEGAQQSCGEALQVHGSGGQQRLDAHVPQTAADGASQPVPGFRLAVEAL